MSDKQVLSTVLDPAEASQVRTRAAAGDRSVAAEIRRALRGYFQNDERPEANRASVTTCEPVAARYESKV